MVYHTETSNQRFSAYAGRLHARLVRLRRFTKKNLQHTTYKAFAEAELNPYGRFGSLLIDLAAGDTSVGSTPIRRYRRMLIWCAGTRCLNFKQMRLMRLRTKLFRGRMYGFR